MEEENTSCDDHQDQIVILLPQDVLIQILVLLPVISLLRFKSVCKSWRALIQSSLFIDLHLNTTTTTTNNNNFGTFIYQTISGYEAMFSSSPLGHEAFIMFSSSSAAAGDDKFEEELLKLEDLGFPPRYKNSPGKDDILFMVGSCNGLICIHDTKRRDVSLWNPATRQFRLLPKSLLTTPQQQHIMLPDFVAFGYDVKTNDYKVLLISYFIPHNKMSDAYTVGIYVEDYIFRVQVYSLSTDSWRLLEGINSLPALPRLPNDCNNGVYLKKTGCYYFLGTYFIDPQPIFMLLSFDFTKEIFTTIKLPHDYHLTTILTSFGEKQLAVFAQTLEKKTYDIWVLNEEHHDGGVKEEEEEPWTKLQSMRLHCIGNPIKAIPRSISNNGEFAVIFTEGFTIDCNDEQDYNISLELFSLVTQEVKKWIQTGTVMRAEVYKQSLVSIGGNGTTVDS